MKFKNTKKILKFLIPGLLISTVATTTIVATKLFDYSPEINNQNQSLDSNNTLSNNNQISNLNTDQQKTTSFNFYPSNNNFLKINRPRSLDINNSSIWPTFNIGGNDISLNLNSDTSSSNGAINFGNFNIPFVLNQPSESEPLNTIFSSENVNLSTPFNNTFLGYQIYNSGSLVNQNNYGSTLKQNLANSDGKSLINNCNFSNFQPLILNPSNSAVISISSAGVSQKENQNYFTISTNNLNQTNADNPLNGYYVYNDNKNIVPNSQFFYNFVAYNNQDTNKYEFYAPTTSTSYELTYNGQSGTVETIYNNITPSEFAKQLANGKTEYINKFNLSINNSLNPTSNFNHDIKLELIPNDENGIVSFNITINNYLEVKKISSNTFIYNILPSKTFNNALTLKGFRSGKVYNVPLSFLDQTTISNAMNGQWVNLGNIDSFQNNGINVNYANIFATNNGNDINSNQIIDWTPTVNNDIINQKFKNKPINFINFNYNNGILSPNINEEYFSNLIDFQNGYYGYASISNINSKNQNANDTQFIFNQPSIVNNQQWLSLSYWNSNFNNYIFSNQYTSINPVNFGKWTVTQPFTTANNKKYFSIFNPVINAQNSTIEQNNPININIRIRNDAFDKNNINGTSILNLINRAQINGHNFQQLQPNEYFEYLNGILVVYNNTAYWCTPLSNSADSYTQSVVTTVTPDQNNCGLDPSAISNITPSEYLSNQNLSDLSDGMKLKINFNAASIATIVNSQIQAYPNDVDGTIDFVLTPGMGVNTNFVSNNMSIDNKQILEYESKPIDSIHFKVSGFKKTSIVEDTTLLSDTLDVATSQDAMFKDAYITYAIDNYLTSTQKISDEILKRKNDILLLALQRCFNNIYNPVTKQKINIQKYSDIANMVSNVQLTIPEDLQATGYNYLNLSFDLSNVAIGGVISNQTNHYVIKIQFKLPESIQTSFNPLMDLASGDPNQNSDITNNDIYQILNNNGSNNSISNRYQLLNYLLTGYQDIANINSQQTNSFTAIHHQISGGTIDSKSVPVIVNKNENFIFGYPSDFYLAYQNNNNTYKNNDELDPKNSWTISDLILNNDSVSFNLGLKYYVNQNGIITANNSNGGLVYKIFGNKLKGKYSSDKTTTLIAPQPPGYPAPNSQILASEITNSKDDNLNNILNRIIPTIINKPENFSIDNLSVDGLVPNNINGTLTFDLYTNKMLIDGQQQDLKEPFLLGNVSIYGFKKVKQTILKTEFNANKLPNNQNSNDVVASSLSTKDIEYIIAQNGFLNAPSNISVSISVNDGINIDNLNGTITLDGSKVKLMVSNFVDENGSTISDPTNFLNNNEQIIIKGFKTISPTCLSNNQYNVSATTTIKSFYDKTGNIDVNKIKNIVINYLINTPIDFTESNIFIDNPTVSDDGSQISFNIKLSYYYNDQGEQIGESTTIADINNSFGFPNNNFVISGFNNDNKNTQTAVVEAGTSFNQLSTYIATNYVDFSNKSNFGYQFSDGVGVQLKNQLKDYIYKSINSGYQLITNTPEDFNINNFDLYINGCDNNAGTLRLSVVSNNYYDSNGNLVSGSEWNKIGNIIIGGFRNLPNSTTSLYSDNYLISGQTNISVNDVDDLTLEQLISKNIFSIFKNVPNVDLNPLSSTNDPNVSKNKLDYPTFNTNVTSNSDTNVFVSNVQKDDVNGTITCNISLNSYYDNDPNQFGTIVWNNSQQKDFGQLTIKGFKTDNTTTSLSSTIDLSSYSDTNANDLKQATPNDILNQYNNFDESQDSISVKLKNFILQNAVVYKPTDLTINDMLLNNFSIDNENGTVSCNVILTKYYKNGNEISAADFNDPNIFRNTILITGFKQVFSTYVPSNIDASTTQYKDRLPSSFDFNNQTDVDAIKSLIKDNILNVPDDFNINDIQFNQWTADNKTGQIIINNIYISNFFDPSLNNNINSNAKNFGQVIIYNLKTVSGITSIKNTYNISDASAQQLPYQWINSQSPNNYETLKQFIIDNLIVNAPNNISNDDLIIDNIIANNITGEVTFTLKLKKYFDNNLNEIDAANINEYLSKDVTITGFNSIQPTTIEPNLTYSIFENNGLNNLNTATSFLNALNGSDSSKLDTFKNILYNYAINYEFSDLKPSDITVDLSSAVANNLEGTLTLSIGLTKCINVNGIYVESTGTNQNNQPIPVLVQQVIIAGFDQTTQTYISSTPISYTGNEIAQNITESEAKKFVFDNLVINKPSDMVVNDLTIKDWNNRTFNNNLGQLSFEIGCNNHYYNEDGVEVNEKPTEIKYYKVNLIIHNTVLPTSVKNRIDASSIANNTTASDFAANLNSKDQIISLVANNLYNKPADFQNTDIDIQSVFDDDGNSVLGEANNINGELKVKLIISNYYDLNNAKHVNLSNDKNAKPLILTTTLFNFKKVNSDQIISCPNEIDLSQQNDSELYNKLASDFTANNYLNSYSIIAQTVLKNINNWYGTNNGNPPSDSNQIIQLDNSQRIPYFYLNSLVADNINGTLTVKYQVSNFINENGIYQSKPSNEYTTVIKNFRKINPTKFNNSNVQLTGQIGSQLATIINKNLNLTQEYNQYTNFNQLNLLDVKNISNEEEFLACLVYNQMVNGNILSNLTNNVQNFINNGIFNINTFNQFFTINNINIDYMKGTISLDVGLNEYYSSSNGLLVQNGNTQLTGHFIFSGFMQTKVTSINAAVSLPSDLTNLYAASDFASNDNTINLKKFIINHQELFFNNLPENFNFSDQLVISDVTSSNNLGILTFKLSLKYYFDSQGNYVNTNQQAQYLTQTVTLSGFQVLNPTTMVQNIDVTNVSQNIFTTISSINGTYDINQITPQLVQQSLYTYRDGTSVVNKTFNNLPPEFNKNDIFVQDQSDWITNYQNGTITLKVYLSSFVNNNFQIQRNMTGNNRKEFTLTISGFNKVSEATQVTTSLIDMSQFGYGNIFSENFSLNDLNKLLYSNDKFINQILSPLPLDFNPKADITNVMLFHQGQDTTGLPDEQANIVKSLKPNQVYIQFDYTNYYEKDSDNNILVNNQNKKTACVVLGNFKGYNNTTISNNWDLSNTLASTHYPGTEGISNEQLITCLNNVKDQYISNPSQDPNRKTNIINVDRNQTSIEDLENGILNLKIYVENTVNEDGGISDQVISKDITVSGFKKQTPSYGNSEKITIPLNGISLANSIPSQAFDITKIIKTLNDPNNNFFNQIFAPNSVIKNNDGSYLTSISSVFYPTPNGEDINMVHVNDQDGSMEFGIKVKNTYNPELGTIDTNEQTLKTKNDNIVIVRLTGFVKAKETSFYNLNNPISNAYMSTTGNQVFYLNEFLLDPKRAQAYLTKNNIIPGSLGNEINQIGQINFNIQNPIKNNDNGTIQFSFQIQNAIKFETVDNIQNLINQLPDKDANQQDNIQKQQYYDYFNNQLKNKFDGSSLIVTNNRTLDGSFTLNGFSTLNKTENNFLFYFAIAAVSTIGLILIILLIVFLFKRRVK